MPKGHQLETGLKGWNPDRRFLEPKVRGHWDPRIRGNAPKPLSRAACCSFPGHLSRARGPLQAFTVRTVAMFLLDAEEINNQ